MWNRFLNYILLYLTLGYNFIKSKWLCLKLLSAIFQQIFIYHQMIALRKLWKMFFISSKKLFLVLRYLKSVSAIFYQIFICSPNDSPSKTEKCFLFHLKKLFSFSRYSIFCNFFTCFPHFSRYKRANGCGIINDVMNWLAYIISRHNFWNNSATALYYIIKLGQIIYN